MGPRDLTIYLPLNPASPANNNERIARMSTKRHLVETDARGQISGSVFDDRAIIEDIEEATLCKIEVSHTQFIISITVRLHASGYGGRTDTRYSRLITRDSYRQQNMEAAMVLWP